MQVAGALQSKGIVWNSENDLSLCLPFDLVWTHVYSLCFNMPSCFTIFLFVSTKLLQFSP